LDLFDPSAPRIVSPRYQRQQQLAAKNPLENRDAEDAGEDADADVLVQDVSSDPSLERLRLGHPGEAEQLLASEADLLARLRTDVRVANAWLDCCARWRSWRTAEAIFEGLRTRGPAPDVHTYRAMIQLYLRCKAPHQIAKIATIEQQMQEQQQQQEQQLEQQFEEPIQSTSIDSSPVIARAPPSLSSPPPSPSFAGSSSLHFSPRDLDALLVTAAQSGLDAQVLYWARRCRDAVAGPNWEQSVAAHEAVRFAVRRARKRVRQARQRSEQARERERKEALRKIEEEEQEEGAAGPQLAFTTPAAAALPSQADVAHSDDLYSTFATALDKHSSSR
jgi:pentatricopeptide repeat protein